MGGLARRKELDPQTEDVYRPVGVPSRSEVDRPRSEPDRPVRPSVREGLPPAVAEPDRNPRGAVRRRVVPGCLDPDLVGLLNVLGGVDGLVEPVVPGEDRGRHPAVLRRPVARGLGIGRGVVAATRRDADTDAPTAAAPVSATVVVTAGTGAGHFQYEKVAVDDARPERGGKLAVPTPVPRPQANLEPLADSTIRWLAELPAGSRPAELARLFPRVANKVCGLWADPRRCGEYLTNLLMDTRDGSRQGFPMKVAAEIVALHAGAETPAADHPSGQVKIKSEQ